MTINLLELQMPKENRKRSKEQGGDRPPRPSKPSRPEPSKARWCHICRVYNRGHQPELCSTTTCLSCGGKGHQKPRCPYLRCHLSNEMGHISIVCSLHRIHRASQRSASAVSGLPPHPRSRPPTRTHLSRPGNPARLRVKRLRSATPTLPVQELSLPSPTRGLYAGRAPGSTRIAGPSGPSRRWSLASGFSVPPSTRWPWNTSWST